MKPPLSGLSEHYALKALFERVLGHESFLHVKEYAPLSAWKLQASRLLKVLARSIELSVMVADDDWRSEVNELLDRGVARVKAAPSVSELHASLAATLGELAFLQIGLVPDNQGQRKAPPVNSIHWNLALARSVQYVQSSQQKLDATRMKARRLSPSSEA